MGGITNIKSLLAEVWRDEKSSFYRSLYEKAGCNSQTPFPSLPFVQWQDIQAASYLSRLYVQERLFTKIVYRDGKPALIGRTSEDVATESYGMACERPLVLFKNVHENVEKGLWFYQKNILPLMAEHSRELTVMMAGKYDIDAIVGDPEEIAVFLPLFGKNHPLEKLRAIRMLGKFENGIPSLSLYSRRHVTAALFLPEGGIIGEMCPLSSPAPLFHLNREDIFEIESDMLMWTKIRLLPTPLIRYNTGIRGVLIFCPCEERAFSLKV